MTVSDYLQKSSPKKRKANKLQQASRCLLPNVKEQGGEDDGNCDTDEEMEVDTGYCSVSVPMQGRIQEFYGGGEFRVQIY